jgi:hypothetical protein
MRRPDAWCLRCVLRVKGRSRERIWAHYFPGEDSLISSHTLLPRRGRDWTVTYIKSLSIIPLPGCSVYWVSDLECPHHDGKFDHWMIYMSCGVHRELDFVETLEQFGCPESN